MAKTWRSDPKLLIGTLWLELELPYYGEPQIALRQVAAVGRTMGTVISPMLVGLDKNPQRVPIRAFYEKFSRFSYAGTPEHLRHLAPWTLIQLHARVYEIVEVTTTGLIVRDYEHTLLQPAGSLPRTTINWSTAIFSTQVAMHERVIAIRQAAQAARQTAQAPIPEEAPKPTPPPPPSVPGPSVWECLDEDDANDDDGPQPVSAGW